MCPEHIRQYLWVKSNDICIFHFPEEFQEEADNIITPNKIHTGREGICYQLELGNNLLMFRLNAPRSTSAKMEDWKSLVAGPL